MAEEDTKGQKNPLIFLIIVINLGITLFLLINQLKLDSDTQKIIDQGMPVPRTENPLPYNLVAQEGNSIQEYEMNDFSANLLRKSGPQRYLKMGMTLMVETSTKLALTEMANKTPDLRDEIISIINDTEAKDVLKLEGRSVFKNKLIRELNLKLKDDKVRSILFTQFTIK